MDSVPVVPDVPVYAGDSLTFPAYVFTSSGDPVDLSGWVLTAQWRRNPGSSTVIELTVDASEAGVGRVLLSATPVQTRQMGTAGVFDLQGVLAGEVKTWLRGSTVWLEDVTRV